MRRSTAKPGQIGQPHAAPDILSGAFVVPRSHAVKSAPLLTGTALALTSMAAGKSDGRRRCAASLGLRR